MPHFKKLSQENVNLFDVIKPANWPDATHAMTAVEMICSLNLEIDPNKDDYSDFVALLIALGFKKYPIRFPYERESKNRFVYTVTQLADYRINNYKI